MIKLMLNGKWKVLGKSLLDEEISLEGTVPGCALNDILSTDGNDIFYRDNAENYQKWENYDWKYTKTFSLDKLGAFSNLVFERLDTYCDVYLNGAHIASCDNGNIAHKFDVTSFVKLGENLLEICFHSPIEAVKDKEKLSGAFTTERLHTRRPQCTYGWDWAMRFVSAGITRDAYIEIYETLPEVKTAYIYTKVIDDECAIVGVDAHFFKENTNKIYNFEIIDGENKVVKHIEKYLNEDFVRMDICISNPNLWYPAGYGEQNLYTFVIKDKEKVLYSAEFGIRTACVIELEDIEGSENYKKCLELKKSNFSKTYDENKEFSSFVLKVNGKKIRCKGANWVPCHPFAMGNTDKRITEILTFAKSAGVNMIRVWGGGAFETEHFYDECSRLGIMVTQDFLMACGQYPEKEEWFIKQLKKEAEYASELLRNKACLMWWSGDNENAVDGSEIDTDYSGRSSMYEAIAPVLYQNDPYRRAFASSPYGGKKYASNTVGTTHNTQYLGDFFRYILDTDMQDYKEYFKSLNARFIAEETCFGSVSLSTLKKFMTDEDIFGEDMAMWYYHTKSNPSLAKELLDYALEFARKVLGEFKDTNDRFFKYKYLQYEWIRITLERVRRSGWFCSGIIYWMLNDSWPASSGWAIIDYYNKPKPAFYSFKRGAKDILASLDCDDGKFNLYISNDGKEQKAKTELYLISEGGKAKKISKSKLTAEDSTTAVADSYRGKLSQNEILVGEVTTESGDFSRCFYKNGDLEIVPCDSGVKIVSLDENKIRIKASKYVHVVELEGDAVFDDNYFSMMPNEEREIAICDKQSDIKLNLYTIKILK